VKFIFVVPYITLLNKQRDATLSSRSLLFTANLLYMFRVLSAFIIRITLKLDAITGTSHAVNYKGIVYTSALSYEL
jgi:hypothetical protein